MSNKKIRKALDRANKEKTRYVIVIGEDKVANNHFKIKDMLSGDERMESFQFR